MPPMSHTSLAAFALTGLLGGLLGAHLRAGGLELPRLVHTTPGGPCRLDLGCLTSLIAGAIAGIYADESLWNAACWGFGAVKLLEGATAKIGDSPYNSHP